MSKPHHSLPKRVTFYLLLLLIPLIGAFLIGEIGVRLFSPVPYMYPRYNYSPEYGFMLYPSTRMVHGWPGKFTFHYTTNEYNHRGKAVSLSEAGEKPSVIVLGDSYSFGMGVNDGEEYAVILEDELRGSYDVINLATPGWGLTQEIRRFYEFGRLYKPDFVVLQYCSNDPEDNLNNRVTTIDAGEFTFQNSTGGINWIKKYLSGSIIQKSQLYNFGRGRVYELFQNRRVNKQAEQLATTTPIREGVLPREKVYCELIEKFSEELNSEGIRLVVISVDNQMKRFQSINECVLDLHARGRLHHIDIKPWLKGVRPYQSPEGHWSTGIHQAIGRGLARHIESTAMNTGSE